MRTRKARWLPISLVLALFGGCGEDPSSDPASSTGGTAGEASEAGAAGEAGSSASDAGAGGSGAAGTAGAAGAAPGGQGGAGQGGAGGQVAEPDEVVIASAQEGPTGIALDADFVYWANQDAGTIVRCPLTGCGTGSPTEIVSEQPGVRGIDVDDTSIYWIRPPEDDDVTRVRKCPLAGCSGEPEVLLEFPYENPNDNDVHVDGDLFYFGAWPQFGTCPTAGCLVSDLVTFDAAPAVSVDTDSEYIYVAKYGFGAIHRCTAPDCTDNVVLVEDTVPLSVAVDETTLYFAAYDAFGSFPTDPHEILKCPLAGCGADPPEVIRSEDISPYAIAVNETRLFFTNVEQGTVISIAKSAP